MSEHETPPPVPEPGAAGGTPDMGALLSQFGQMAQDLQAAQAEAANRVVTGTAGGGAVTVALTAGFEARSVSIDPTKIDAGDTELLGDLILAALRDALEQAQAVQGQAMGGIDFGSAAGMLGL